MTLMRVTSPHAHGPMSTAQVMRTVLLATVPGVLALTWFFGFGTLVNIAWACLVALASEALALKLRRRPLAFYLKDCSALVTATLLAVAGPRGLVRLEFLPDRQLVGVHLRESGLGLLNLL